MGKTKQFLVCVIAAHMLLSMMAMVILSRKRKWSTIRVGITYGPIAERDRMRIEYLNTKIWKNDITCINMIQISRNLFFHFVTCLEIVVCLKTPYICGKAVKTTMQTSVSIAV
jgi:hypothetical protein